MQQIADWLEKLGMSEYAERFTESDIDTSVLCDLTDQDLKELGVSLRRPPPALGRDTPAGTGDRWRLLSGRAAQNGPAGSALLADGLRLADHVERALRRPSNPRKTAVATLGD
jgi:SAM domain (Sterile alpha motif)